MSLTEHANLEATHHAEQPHPAAGGLKAVEHAARGWASSLAMGVVAGLAIEIFTGFWIYLAPFSIATQIQVVLHTVGGLLLTVPCLVYLVRHFLVWYAQKASVVMVLGYLLSGMVLASLVTGLVLTWQAAVGPRISPLWDLVHLVSGMVAAALVIAHLGLALWRRRAALAQVPLFRFGVRRFAYGSVACGLLAALLVVAPASLWPGRQVEISPPEGYSLSTYLENFDEYKGNPFAPSYARTEQLNLIDTTVLSNSASCGTAGCHEQIYAEWQPSAHRFSAMNPSFQAIQKNFAADREPAETRYCAGCHDPISLFAGAKDIHNLSLSAPGMQEGCSCAMCHSIAQVDQRGNADYVLVPPREYIWQQAEGWRKLVSDFLIRAYPRQHLVDYDRAVLRSPEFCGACHKQFIPEALNRFGLVAGQNQYDEWRNSHWHVDDPDQSLSCVDCHMRLVPDSFDPGRGENGAIRRRPDDGSHRHHGTIATNFYMPMVLKLPHWQRQVELTKEWIEGRTVIPEIAQHWPTGPVATVQIVAPEQVRPGQQVELRVLVNNHKAGHNLTTGPLDFMRAWIHLSVVDESGKTIAEWGGIDPVTREITDLPGQIHQIGNSRKEGTLVLEGLPLNERNEPILRHELWSQAGGKGKRVIFPGHSDHQTYIFSVPENARGKLTAHADFNFRRYRQEFLNLVLPTLEKDTGMLQPMMRQSFAEKQINIVPDAASQDLSVR